MRCSHSYLKLCHLTNHMVNARIDYMRITVGVKKTISIDDLRRNFGEIKKELPSVTFILTDRGREIATLKASREIKQAMRQSTAGSFKGTELDNDALWKDVLKRHSRKSSISL